MIVEDEPRLRNSLSLDIPWKTYDIEIVAVAASGEEALVLLERKKPDILLVDIQMQGMNGIELSRRVMEKDSLVRVIILSGHDNFEYAQAAMELGITKYLLKPAGEKEIIHAVQQAADDLKKHLDGLHNLNIMREKWQQYLPNLQEMFLLNWLHGKYVNWEIERRSMEVKLNLENIQMYSVAVLDMDPIKEDDERFYQDDQSLLQSSLKSICAKTFETEPIFTVMDQDGSTVLIFTTERNDSEALQYIVNANVSRIMGIVKECLKVTASAGISGVTREPLELNMLYEQARTALQQRILYGDDLIVHHQENDETMSGRTTYPELERQLEIALDTGSEAGCMDTFSLLWNRVMTHASSVDVVQEGLFYFNSLMIRLIQQKGYSVKEVAGDDINYLQDINSIITKEQAWECHTRLLNNLLNQLASKKGAAGHKTVEAALQMIESSLHEELSLHMVAEKLFINSSYLSRLFKQETGMSFSAYVMERKMHKAKAALQDGAKVYDAAKMTGYKDVSYFTKVFRRYWGVTPGGIGKGQGSGNS